MLGYYVGSGGECDSQWAASRIVVRFGEETKDWVFFALNSDADGICHRLSKEMPSASIAIQQCARVRARYENGVRIQRFELRHFYENISDEMHKESQLYNSKYNYNDPEQPQYF